MTTKNMLVTIMMVTIVKAGEMKRIGFWRSQWYMSASFVGYGDNGDDDDDENDNVEFAPPGIGGKRLVRLCLRVQWQQPA